MRFRSFRSTPDRYLTINSASTVIVVMRASQNTKGMRRTPGFSKTPPVFLRKLNCALNFLVFVPFPDHYFVQFVDDCQRFNPQYESTRFLDHDLGFSLSQYSVTRNRQTHRIGVGNWRPSVNTWRRGAWLRPKETDSERHITGGVSQKLRMGGVASFFT